VNSSLFLVTQAEAHSWPEIYFPGVGWVPFEPTAGRPAFNQVEQPAPEAVPTPVKPTKPVTHTKGRAGKSIGFAGLSLIALVGMGWAIGDEIIMRRMPAPRQAVEIYRRLRRYGRFLDAPEYTGETPYEFAAQMSQTLSSMAAAGTRPAAVENLVQEVQSTVRQVVRLSFRPSGRDQRDKLFPHWRHLLWRLRWMWVLGRWVAFRKRVSDWLINSPLPIDRGEE
jgi:hypothetical protein